ncbi:hypothetical protein [Cerasicoccus fimbriatus]|uniref:hypothetical protein n=1 Tax=Cerasicoccus fimbriatus TaxID=3014554 RepID=UPI0022B52DA1|nr:hypothetical protein [Cerasicoccus sp. TK19100]
MRNLSAKILTTAAFLGAALLSPALSADLEWQLNKASFDDSKLGPDGKPALKIEPGGSAILKLSDSTTSGSVSMAVWDDGTKVIKEKGPSGIGPRWGVSSSNGQVIVGGIMYARYLAEGGSLCIIDAKPSEPGSWYSLNYLGARKETNAWQTWKFDFNAQTGLHIDFNGKPVEEKRFDWNTTQLDGMDGIVIYGDETGKPNAQTLYVGDIQYTVGPAMVAKPTPPPPPPPVVPDSDPKATKVYSLKLELQGKHPRLMLTAEELPKLRKFYNSPEGAVYREKIEGYVGASRVSVGDKWLKNPTDSQRQGFWRVPTVALHYLMTGDKESLEATKQHLRDFNAQPHWELGNERDSGMSAANIMVGAALAYDWIFDELEPEFRKEFGEKLLWHARAMYYGGHLKGNPPLHYWQNDPANNHRWHRNAGMTLCILAVYEGREDQQWILQKTVEELHFIQKWLPTDGSCHEGPNYFTFGGNHLTCAFDAADIALGTDLMSAEYFKAAGQFRMGTLLPSMDGIFSFGDGGKGSLGTYNNFLFAGASHNQQADIKDGLLTLQERQPDAFMFGWFSLLWDDPDLKRGDFKKLPTDTLWEDVGFASMRESWEQDVVAASFICGPFGGYDLLKFANGGRDYVNVAHDDPDAGEFLIAKGGVTFVKTDGYSKKKASKNHNTILINGMGQMTRGRPEGTVWSQPSTSKGTEMTQMAYVTSWKTTDKIAAIEGESSGSYLSYSKQGQSRPDLERFRRSFLWVEGDYILVLDDIRSPERVEIDWLVQGDDITPLEESEGRFQFVSEGQTMDMQLFCETELDNSLRDSPADDGGKLLGYRQLMASTSAEQTRYTSVYDPWKKNVSVEFAANGPDKATVTVTGKDFKDVWTWEAAKDNETASTITVERESGDKIGFPFTVDDSSNCIMWKHLEIAAAH